MWISWSRPASTIAGVMRYEPLLETFFVGSYGILARAENVYLTDCRAKLCTARSGSLDRVIDLPIMKKSEPAFDARRTLPPGCRFRASRCGCRCEALLSPS